MLNSIYVRHKIFENSQKNHATSIISLFFANFWFVFESFFQKINKKNWNSLYKEFFTASIFFFCDFDFFFVRFDIFTNWSKNFRKTRQKWFMISRNFRFAKNNVIRNYRKISLIFDMKSANARTKSRFCTIKFQFFHVMMIVNLFVKHLNIKNV